ncbi:MAG TPA: AAA family ATPase [Gammaproteobacteria bacterium]
MTGAWLDGALLYAAVAAAGGFVAGLLLQRYVLGRRAARPRSATGAPPADPAHADAAAPADDLTARLLPLRQTLEAFGESSAHPRELEDRAEFQQAVALLGDPQVPTDTVLEYALGANWPLSCAAFAALGARTEHARVVPEVVPRLKQLGNWPLYFALQYLAAAPERPPVGAVLVRPNSYWHEMPLVLSFFASYFRKRAELGDTASFGDALDGPGAADAADIERVLAAIEHPSADALLAELTRWQARRVDRTYLTTIGRFWDGAENDLLVEHEALREPLLAAEAAVTHDPPRSLLVVGEPRVGKTSLVRLLARNLAARGYAVFEAGAAEIMAGQTYFGQLEERIRRLTAELAAEKRVLWYVPSFWQIASSGKHQGQSASILDQILPAMTAGRIIVIGECTPGALTRLLETGPLLRSAVDLVRLHGLSASEASHVALDFAGRLERAGNITVSVDAVAAAMQLAAQYLTGGQLPGTVLDLVKLAAHRTLANDEPSLTRDSVLAALSQTTGLPQAILDDRERTDLARVREFFTARVMGQREAVDAVVERIAMLKAGLTDPGRPIGVFLFAGPTGTGKTELAKALAEYLFGSSERLVRLDMSEFQLPESTRLIVGAPDEADVQSLAHRVRKQPFSVVLLDELEKAHPRVWDLFLQVFDDGRLTDAAGRTADFRHTFIILTSNLGATEHESAALGFAPGDAVFSHTQVLRAVGRSFRPEFVNRLDKVIVFRPLTRDVMRGILRKELKRVLERRGLRNREWAVEWESSALEFLLDKGFSASLGARPLKRAIDEHLLAPLAATMVEHRVPSGDQFLFVRSDGRRIQVEFVDPDEREAGELPLEAPEGTAKPGLPAVILGADGSERERALLEAAGAAVRAALEGERWQALHAALTAEMAAPGFWERAERHRVLARFALLDRVKAAAQTAHSLLERYARGVKGQPGRYSRDLARRLALQLHLLEAGIADALEDRPVEIVAAVELAVGRGTDAADGREWCRRIAGMYCAWAERRHMQLERVQAAGLGAPLLVIAGFGAHAVMEQEAGLHVLEAEAPSRPGGLAVRTVARVRVAPTPYGPPERRLDAAALVQALAARPASAAVVRRYRFEPSPLVRDARRGWRVGRAQDVMAGHFDLFAAVEPSAAASPS